MTLAIVDYGSGNIRSAAKAFERAARDSGLPSEHVQVVRSAESIHHADRVVVPGVGAFADCRAGVLTIDGLWQALDEHVKAGKPLLGICVGMQLMATTGLEHGQWTGFGWIPGTVKAIGPSGSLKVPHMGWNDVQPARPHPLLDGLSLGPDGLNAYFCHSYHMVADNPGDVLLTASYGATITAMVARENVAGTQFHPEKSQELGLRLIGNFLRWRP
jgi:glutamine amidotransferase